MEFSLDWPVERQRWTPPPSPSGKSCIWRPPHCRGLISPSLRECGRHMRKKKKKRLLTRRTLFSSFPTLPWEGGLNGEQQLRLKAD